MKRIARVFPRKTSMSPTDPLAFFDAPTDLSLRVDEVHVSVAFTYDVPRAEQLARDWAPIAPVKVGGPAFGKPSGEFVPGMYLREGVTITSRGCPNRCWFCSVPKREPELLELPIQPGYIVQDDNLLACSDAHIWAVFEMLAYQRKRPQFLGGLEAKLLKPWHATEMRRVRTQTAFFAYDTPDDYEVLVAAGAILEATGLGFKSRVPRCFVLCGFPKDTITEAEIRMRKTVLAGFWPQAMLWKNDKGDTDKTWGRFARYWARPIMYAREAIELRMYDALGYNVSDDNSALYT